MFTKSDVGLMLIIDPTPWYLKIWHFIWFRILRRKTPTKGIYVITEVVDSTTITIDRRLNNRGSGEKLTVL